VVVICLVVVIVSCLRGITVGFAAVRARTAHLLVGTEGQGGHADLGSQLVLLLPDVEQLVLDLDRKGHLCVLRVHCSTTLLFNGLLPECVQEEGKEQVEYEEVAEHEGTKIEDNRPEDLVSGLQRLVQQFYPFSTEDPEE